MSRTFPNRSPEETKASKRWKYCSKRKGFCSVVGCKTCTCSQVFWIFSVSADRCCHRLATSEKDRKCFNAGKTTVKPRSTTYPHKASTTGSQGNKNMIRGGNKSNAGAIAGAVIGVVILIVLAAVFLYLRKRKQKKGAKNVNGKAPLDIQFNDLKSREEVENPASPDGIYTYADAGTISRPNGSTMNAVGNPTYNHNISISEPFYNVLEADQNDSQPVYREVVPEQVYMDPNESRNAGGNQDQQEQPIYRELEEESPAYAPIDQPICRELEEETPSSPVYADIANSSVDKMGPQSPRQYQELNYAATPNVYQPLDNDWKSQKYNR